MFNQPSRAKKADLVSTGNQSKMLMDSGLEFQRLLITAHMVITKVNI